MNDYTEPTDYIANCSMDYEHFHSQDDAIVRKPSLHQSVGDREGTVSLEPPDSYRTVRVWRTVGGEMT